MTVTLMADGCDPRPGLRRAPSDERPPGATRSRFSPPAAAAPRTRPGPRPPGTAKSPLASCRRNGDRASPRSSLRCTGTKPCSGSACQQTKSSPASGAPSGAEAVVVREGAPQHAPRRRSGPGARDPGVGVDRDDEARRRRRSCRGPSAVVSVPPDSGAPSDLRRPMTFSWRVERRASPSRRGASGSGVRPRRSRPPSRPGLAAEAGTKIRWSKSVSDGLGLLVPSIWPIRLRAVMGAAVAPGVRLKPFICQRTPGRAARVLLQRAQRVEGDQGVVGADLHPQVAVAARRCRGGRRRSRAAGRAAGRCVVQPGAGEEGAAEAEGDGQRGRPGVQGDAGVVRAAAGSPAISRSAVADQRRSSAAASLRPAPAARSKAIRWPWACSGVVMPGLVFRRETSPRSRARRPAAVEPRVGRVAGAASAAARGRRRPRRSPGSAGRARGPRAPAVPGEACLLEDWSFMVVQPIFTFLVTVTWSMSEVRTVTAIFQSPGHRDLHAASLPSARWRCARGTRAAARSSSPPG